ncbi:hypothetical protein BU198_33505 [Streptomyces sp. CBMA156]|nr:hypothetical protein [Streptomyces sp. CBMA156]
MALFDLNGDQAEGARCKGPDCETALPPRTGRGRRATYCSQACKSRADRARVKARTVTVLPGPDGPAVAADATPKERPEGQWPAAGLPAERQRVLGAADAIRKRAEDFLAAVDGDPMSAHAKLAEDVYVLLSLLVTSARDVRDAVRWPGLDADARTAARIREEWNLPDGAFGDLKSDRGDFPAPAGADTGAGETPRGEKGTVSAARPNVPKPPRDETTGTAARIAVEHQDGKPGRFVAGSPARPRTFTTADLALDMLHRPGRPRTAGRPAASVAPVAEARQPGKVQAPKLTLGRATGWTPPTDRGLGEAHRDYALGAGLVHLTWPSTPAIQALEQRGRLAGWTEVYDDAGNWVALLNGHPVADAADGVSLLSANPADALTLLRLALDQGLAASEPARSLPRSHG